MLQILEDIDAKKVYKNKYKTLMSIIRGERDVGSIELSKDYIPKLEKYGLGVIPLKTVSQDTIHLIVYRDKEKALKLYKIAKSKGGYFRDDNPNEAYEIGKLFGYSDESIDEYIKKKYGKIPHEFDFENDYLSEQREIVGLNKKLIKTIKDQQNNDVKIFAVNGSYVKGKNPGLDFIQFVEGGHYYVDSYPGYKEHIPEDEIWIDDVFLHKTQDFISILNHELLERNLMKYGKMSYEKAHVYANNFEKKIRTKKLDEDYRFQRTLKLIK